MEKHDYGWDPKRVDDGGRAASLWPPKGESMPFASNPIGGEGLAALPIRKPLDHRGPLSIDVSDAIYFITIAAAERGTSTLTDSAATILDAARFYQVHGKWFLYLFLIMPDHIHMLVHVPCERGGEGLAVLPGNSDTSVGRSVPDRREPRTELERVIGNWKHFLSRQCGIAFQRDFFDTRIRDEAHFAEKWNYICNNPVAKGLVATPREWPHSIAFDRATGEEREHR